jgi:hypothetical protein
VKGFIILFMGFSISTTSFGGSFNIRCNSHLKIKPKLDLSFTGLSGGAKSCHYSLKISDDDYSSISSYPHSTYYNDGTINSADNGALCKN